jgi:hypothetical protein
MAPQKEVVLRLASMRYLKAGVSEEDFHEYSTNYHAPKAAIIQARHGALRVSQVRMDTLAHTTVCNAMRRSIHQLPFATSSKRNCHGLSGQAGRLMTMTYQSQFGSARRSKCRRSSLIQTSSR